MLLAHSTAASSPLGCGPTNASSWPSQLAGSKAGWADLPSGAALLISWLPCAKSSAIPKSESWCPPARTCQPGRPGAIAQPRVLRGGKGACWMEQLCQEQRVFNCQVEGSSGTPFRSRSGISAVPPTALQGRTHLLPTRRKRQPTALTLAQERVLRQVPQGRLDHLEVPAAEAVHERGEEVGSDAENVQREKRTYSSSSAGNAVLREGQRPEGSVQLTVDSCTARKGREDG